MSTVTLEMPEPLLQFVQEKARQDGFVSAGEYIVAVVAAASQNAVELEEMLLAGLQSGPVAPWTSEDWQGIRSRLTAAAQQQFA